MSMRGGSVAAILVLLLSACAVAQAVFPPIWPTPQQYTSGKETVVIDATKVQLSSSCGASAELTNAYERFAQRTFMHRAAELGEDEPAVSVIAVCAWNVSVPLQLGNSESYRLSANVDGITVECGEIYGCYHGLETLSQMISFNYSTHRYELHHAPWRVDDYPRFPHRGVLIDTSRHFQPVSVLKQVIDSLTYAKFNVMHWHITDAHAFPMESVKYPRLAEYGAYSAAERLSVEDMKEVRDYAAARGVRVMMEFDSPAHTAAMCAGMPEICLVPSCSSTDVNAWVLDITKQKTHRVVEDLFREITELFPERMVHIGGDEVERFCWEENPFFMEWLAEHNTTLDEVLLDFTKNVESYVSGKLGRVVVGWEEIWTTFGTSLDKDTVVQQWVTQNASRLLADVTSHGYRALATPYRNWYLDLESNTWESAYTFEPCAYLTDEQCALVLGGETCMWSELIDPSVMMNTLWPRGAAVAERLWSRRDVDSVEAAQDRLIRFRCLLNERGVGAAPVLNAIPRRAPPKPGSCYAQ